jgi:uncharacterized heparinase superfamily protein
VRVDGEDQSIIGGNFLWLRHAQTRVSRFACDAEVDYLQAEHDGYQRLDDPLVHRRSLRLEHSRKRLEVTDELICKGTHRIEMFWHFAQSCEVHQHEDQVIASRDGVRLTLRVPEGMCGTLVRGSEAPPLGWRSQEFDVKVPTTTFVAASTIKGSTRFVTEIWVEVADPRNIVEGRSWSQSSSAELGRRPHLLIGAEQIE